MSEDPKMSAHQPKVSPLPMYVEAALPVPLRRVFTYRLPEEMRGVIKLGARLKLPFGRRNVTGYAVGLHPELPTDVEIDESKIKNVIEVSDDEPLITPEILKLTQWTADYYASFWGEMLKASLPAGINNEKVRPKRRKAVRLLTKVIDPIEKPLTDQQQWIIDLLTTNGGEMLFTDVLEQCDVGGSPVNTLAKRGIVEIYIQDVMRDPLAGAALPGRDELILTPEQQTAFDAITGALEKKDEFKAFLLHGVTGSGKTEVYIRAMQSALDTGRSAIMLVPEIALTPVFSRRLRRVFGADVAILHSNLSIGERYDEWRRIRRGDARIVIGTRSAVFAPVENIGLIIIDEEHDPSYRQHESPFYNARDVGVMRGSMAGAVVVLGSATPAMESFYNAQTGKYTYLRLPDRIGGRGLATAELIDMREVFKQAGKDVALSPQLLNEIKETHARGEQVIILLNRRGFSQFVLCRSCGETLKCKNCDITLTFHRGDGKLLCHYCNYREKAPRICPHCQSEYLYFVGEGTENIADQLAKKFPEMRIARVDRDTMSHKGEIDDVLLTFADGGLDMLVGTQMIAKGHDFPNVTLVGVISVDIGLGLPDMRSAERTFQLITQVAGRSGRGEKLGRVLIQTYYPEHYALRHAREQDYEGFYNEEIKFRERLAYPPFVVLASILIKHRDLAYASRHANILRRSLDAANTSRHVRVLGPAPASISRLKNEYRLQIILKGASRRSLRETLDIALADAEANGCDLRSIFVEIDPVNLM
ncbi:MAG TPA: primosomal protein N' [Pyrinomonadaceae bacterium]|nr:primosomal protein N' [Pyrinomonadaceae bacterium]